ncbi:MAG: dethiobiotin synthase [Pseudomarimonas sp.]
MFSSVYLTGTDTDAGKTYAAVALIHALRGHGARVIGMKPLASGCVLSGDGVRNPDALALQGASEAGAAYELINPIALRDATAPEIAAANDGVEVSLPSIERAYAALRESADCVVVEGVGGWMAPLSASLMQADLVRALHLPVLLVVGLRLGCINHALLSLRALQADGAKVLGWIGSAVDPQLAFVQQTVRILRQRIGFPCLGILPHGVDAKAAGIALDLTCLKRI